MFLPHQITPSKPFIEQIANNLAARLLDSTSTKKAFDRWVTLNIPARNAALTPPVGPFLGQHGFHTLNFCTTFNELTKIYPQATPIRVLIKLFTDKTLQFQFKTPEVSYLLYCAYSTNNYMGVTLINLLKIVLIKKIDLLHLSNLSLLASVIGTLWSAKYKII